MEITTKQLALQIGAELSGDGNVMINAVAPVDSAGTNEITFVTDNDFLPKLKSCAAGAVILSEPLRDLNKPQLMVKNVRPALIETLKIFAPRLYQPSPGIDPSAVINPDADIAKTACIGPLVVIERGVKLGEQTVVAAGCRICQNSRIGSSCRLESNVVIHHNCIIGNNCVIQANTTIGSTGFGYYFIDGSHRLIPHNGTVIIEDFVEIGANCCIDRAKFGATRIGAGTKIDNLVQIAHNVVIGKCCLIIAQAGIAGSTTIGDGVVMAGRSSAIDNIKIADRTTIAALSVVTHNIVRPGTELFGMPAIEKAEAFRLIAHTRHLPKLTEKVKQLVERIDRLEKAKVRFRRRLFRSTAAAAVVVAVFILSPLRQVFFDPHEYGVEKLVKRYQDGNDNFYVSASSHLEDLHTGKNLFILSDITQAGEKITADHALLRDSFFLVSYKDLEKLRATSAWLLLTFIGEVDVEGLELILLSTESAEHIVSRKT